MHSSAFLFHLPSAVQGLLIAKLMMVKGVSEEGKTPWPCPFPLLLQQELSAPKESPSPPSWQLRVPIFLCSSPAIQCSVVGRLRGPQRCPHPNLQNWWMSPYNSKIDFVAAMIPMAASWGDYPGLSRWAQCRHRGPHKRETGRSEGEMWSRKQRSEWYRARNQTMWWPLEAGKCLLLKKRNGFYSIHSKEMDSP